MKRCPHLGGGPGRVWLRSATRRLPEGVSKRTSLFGPPANTGSDSLARGHVVHNPQVGGTVSSLHLAGKTFPPKKSTFRRSSQQVQDLALNSLGFQLPCLQEPEASTGNQALDCPDNESVRLFRAVQLILFYMRATAALATLQRSSWRGPNRHQRIRGRDGLPEMGHSLPAGVSGRFDAISTNTLSAMLR
jgi:hypothetical protein